MCALCVYVSVSLPLSMLGNRRVTFSSPISCANIVPSPPPPNSATFTSTDVVEGRYPAPPAGGHYEHADDSDEEGRLRSRYVCDVCLYC